MLAQNARSPRQPSNAGILRERGFAFARKTASSTPEDRSHQFVHVADGLNVIDRGEMSVDGGGLDMCVPQIGLQLVQGHPCRGQMSGKTMPEVVAGYLLAYSHLAGCG